MAERPERPEPGDTVTMPDGRSELVVSVAEDHTGIRVNGQPFWTRPEPPPRLDPPEVPTP